MFLLFSGSDAPPPRASTKSRPLRFAPRLHGALSQRPPQNGRKTPQARPKTAQRTLLALS
eukprot:9479173-Pyramimonas_sp.AAC.1